jgi:hypothetical protein
VLRHSHPAHNQAAVVKTAWLLSASSNPPDTFVGVQREIVAALALDKDIAKQRATERWRLRIAGSLDPRDDTLIIGREHDQRVTVATPDGILMDIRTVEQ